MTTGIDWGFWWVLLSGGALGYVWAQRERLYAWLERVLDDPAPSSSSVPQRPRVRVVPPVFDFERHYDPACGDPDAMRARFTALLPEAPE